jgi:hypothetical protein
MTENKKSYFAVIPANIRYDESLPPNAKLLYGEITALCNAEGYCWASNKYFADLYGVSISSIKRWIKSLIDKGYITSKMVYKEGGSEIEMRWLQICTEGGVKNEPTPSAKNEPDNTTSSNTTTNTTNEYKGNPRFTPPTLEEVQAYCIERHNSVDAERFIDYYTSNGWMVGKNKMKDWKSAVRTWERNGFSNKQQGSGNMFIDMLRERGNTV